MLNIIIQWLTNMNNFLAFTNYSICPKLIINNFSFYKRNITNQITLVQLIPHYLFTHSICYVFFHCMKRIKLKHFCFLYAYRTFFSFFYIIISTFSNVCIVFLNIMEQYFNKSLFEIIICINKSNIIAFSMFQSYISSMSPSTIICMD